jgi:Glycosyltransferases, probably involved in cell wall biogenesis
MDIVVAIGRSFTFRSRSKKKALARHLLYVENPLVTILVPGKNEGKNIFKLVQSLAEQTYKNYEVIVVDDGSDDDTPIIGRDLMKAGYIDKFLRCEVRGGKASAANLGLYYAKGKYVIHLDADSSLDRDAIEKILIPFYLDKRIKGVGGCVKARNAFETTCTSMQALEYLKTIMVGRMVTSALGIYHIISGAFGAFDAKVLKQVGGWDIGPGLDGDITQKIRKCGYKVRFANDAICMTNVPTKWKKLFKQRLRWSKSLVRFRMRKHVDMLLPNKNFSFLNAISNGENILYDFVFNYVWLFYILTICLQHTDKLFEIFLVGWLIRICFSFVAFMIILMVSERPQEEIKLIPYVPLSTFYTGYFLRLARLVAHTREVFFFSSYKDSWNPRKTSIIAQEEGV